MPQKISEYIYKEKEHRNTLNYETKPRFNLHDFKLLFAALSLILLPSQPISPSASESFISVVDYQPTIVRFAEVGNAVQLVRR